MNRPSFTQSPPLVVAACLCLLLLLAPEVCGQTAGPPPPPKPTPQGAPTIVGEAKPKLPPYRAVQSAAAPRGWQQYEFGAAPYFAAFLPAKIETDSEFINMGGDSPVRTFTFSGETDEGVYMVHLIENMPIITERMSETYRQSFLDGLWQGLVNGVKDELEKNGMLMKFETRGRRELKVGGVRVEEQDFRLGPLNGRARVALAGQRAFLLLAMETLSAPSAQMVAFLDSMEIRAPR